MTDEFERFARLAKETHDIVAVCRQRYGFEELFTIPFASRGQLKNFLARNDGETYETGFYAKGYVNGEFIGENT